MDPITEALRREIAQLEILASDQKDQSAQVKETVARINQLRTLLAQLEAPSQPAPTTPAQAFDLRTNLSQWQASLTLDSMERFSRIEKKLDHLESMIKHQESPRRRVSMVLSMILLWITISSLAIEEVRLELLQHPVQAVGIIISIALLAGVIYWLGATSHG